MVTMSSGALVLLMHDSRSTISIVVDGRRWEGVLAECLHAMEYNITGGCSTFVQSVTLSSIRDLAVYLCTGPPVRHKQGSERDRRREEELPNFHWRTSWKRHAMSCILTALFLLLSWIRLAPKTSENAAVYRAHRIEFPAGVIPNLKSCNS